MRSRYGRRAFRASPIRCVGERIKVTGVPEFREVAWRACSMQPGEISEPIKTRFGYHIIKLNKKYPAGYKAFDEVKAGIIKKLKQKDWEIKRAEFFEKIVKDNKMQIDEVAVGAFVNKKLDELDSESTSK